MVSALVAAVWAAGKAFDTSKYSKALANWNSMTGGGGISGHVRREMFGPFGRPWGTWRDY